MKLRSIPRHLPSRRGVMGINARNLLAIYTHNERKFFPNVDDKLRCKQLLAENGIPVMRTFHVADGPTSLRQWETALADVAHFVIKPCRGFGGKGIMLVTRTEDGYRGAGALLTAAEVTHHVLQIYNGAFSLDNASETAFFEDMVFNDERLGCLIAEEVGGIADVRLIFRHETPVMAMVRLPTVESEGIANLHQGGIGVGIDLNTGLTLDGCYHNHIITNHPDTGRALRGHQIPSFAQMLEFGSRISEIVRLGYLGVDFACDARVGPVVLEVNARPGLSIQLATQSGLRSMLN